MARPLRVEYPGAFYHVVNRGNNQENIYKNDRDREKFLEYLMKLTKQYPHALLFFLITSAAMILGCADRPICEKITDPHVGFQNECSIGQWRLLREEYARKNQSEAGRLNPIFEMEKLYKPILFAHRGGALEAPESTLKAFDYALYEAGADVLEVDVQLTKDGEIVVWHGPKLANVYVSKVNPAPEKRQNSRKRIYDFAWCELDGKAWVGDPWNCSLEGLPEATDRDERELLLFSEFLQAYPKAPLNIELKKSFLKKLGGRNGLDDNIEKFFKILEEYGGNRTIIVTSATGRILRAFRNLNNGKYHTTLTVTEQFAIKFFNKSYHKPIVETIYPNFWSNRILVETVHAQGGEIYLFITGFGPILAVDKDLAEDSSKNKIYEILDRGVDGIMTDRPKLVRQIMCRWLKKKLNRLKREEVTH